MQFLTTGMTTHTLNVPFTIASRHDVRRKILGWLIGIAIAGALIYMYFIGSIVINIIARKNIESENRVISSKIAEMQFTYLASMNAIDKAYAAQLGYEVPTHPAFVTKKAVATTLGKDGNEI